MRKIFGKQNVVDTAINVGIGGAANVAVDYALDNVDFFSTMSDSYLNGGKFILGVVGSTMTTNRYAKAALDGIATVGIANLARTWLQDEATESTSGVPRGTIGRVIPGHRYYGRAMRRGGKTSGAGKFVG